MTIAIQGQEDSIHEVAACRLFGEEIQVMLCSTLADVFSAVNTGRAHKGVVAINNTIHGEIVETKELLRRYRSHVSTDIWVDHSESIHRTQFVAFSL